MFAASTSPRVSDCPCILLDQNRLTNEALESESSRLFEVDALDEVNSDPYR